MFQHERISNKPHGAVCGTQLPPSHPSLVHSHARMRWGRMLWFQTHVLLCSKCLLTHTWTVTSFGHSFVANKHYTSMYNAFMKGCLMSLNSCYTLRYIQLYRVRYRWEWGVMAEETPLLLYLPSWFILLVVTLHRIQKCLLNMFTCFTHCTTCMDKAVFKERTRIICKMSFLPHQTCDPESCKRTRHT